MISFPLIALSGMAVGLIFVAAIVLFILLKVVKKLFAKVIIVGLNSLAGLIVLLALNIVFNASIPVNIFTLLVSGIFGLSGVGCLILLKFGGLI